MSSPELERKEDRAVAGMRKLVERWGKTYEEAMRLADMATNTNDGFVHFHGDFQVHPTEEEASEFWMLYQDIRGVLLSKEFLGGAKFDGG